MATMNVLLTGASGFIGKRLDAALRMQGHTVVCAARHPLQTACTRSIVADFTRDLREQDWQPRLAGIDVVINAAGILRENGRQTFESIHVLAPVALFTACVTAGVRRVIQISALGADASARSGYHLSKRRADEFLAKLPLEWVIVQPSIVYGAGGTSARLFTALATLPLIPLPGSGEQRIQPLHVDDLIDGIVALLRNETFWRSRIPFVGPEALTLATFLARLRAAMQLPRARFLRIPFGLVRLAAQLGRRLRSSLLDPETLDMLVRGNTGDPGPLQRLLGRALRQASEFATPADTTLGQRQWLLPVLRWSIALVWIVTGIVSLGLYPQESSYALLARVGVPESLFPLLLYGAAFMDLAFGIATLALRNRQWLWFAQMAVILLYTLIISVRLPEFWLHPFGPLLKNLPMLAAIFLLQQMERR
jgi:uncharacterized protein YbjT (DUF2867 family)